MSISPVSVAGNAESGAVQAMDHAHRIRATGDRKKFGTSAASADRPPPFGNALVDTVYI
jgi:hypothetical protein